MLTNIINHVFKIMNWIAGLGFKLLSLAAEAVMFIALFICGALGFGVFILFMLAMLAACGIAIFL